MKAFTRWVSVGVRLSLVWRAVRGRPGGGDGLPLQEPGSEKERKKATGINNHWAEGGRILFLDEKMLSLFII